MKKNLFSVVMISAFTAMSALNICANDVNQIEDYASVEHAANSGAEVLDSLETGLFFWDESASTRLPIFQSPVSYDTKNVSGNILKFLGGVTNFIPLVKDIGERRKMLDNVFAEELITDIGLLAKAGNMKSEQLILKGNHAALVIPTVETMGAKFIFNVDDADLGTPLSTVFDDVVLHPEHLRCIQLKSKHDSGFRSFPKGLNFTAFEKTIVSKKKGGRQVDVQQKVINEKCIEMTLVEQLEPGEYCFFYTTPDINLFGGQPLYVFDFSVQ